MLSPSLPWSRLPPCFQTPSCQYEKSMSPWHHLQQGDPPIKLYFSRHDGGEAFTRITTAGNDKGISKRGCRGSVNSIPIGSATRAPSSRLIYRVIPLLLHSGGRKATTDDCDDGRGTCCSVIPKSDFQQNVLNVLVYLVSLSKPGDILSRSVHVHLIAKCQIIPNIMM